ncbi:helix-turn-helix domain-containing protein [Lichenihabitans sp. Uapishka_5]|uniref:helix-turn-helix domain-containing protein n=1 Tax=Lichenihabitans sp. Uapishka_5 TaxID=3037302 RepID=UPI0029E8252B|nr:helix-turn-helix domain-containing protein [Lichenihabitans sp. Uapishka_5]MDX7953736.1 helix-turn-helix domain-containing protein [Lichenihabitans sp. Uapishka_5]
MIDSARIKQARTDKGLSQRELAEAMDVSVQAVSQWERGKTIPEYSRFNMLANILGVSRNWLEGSDANKENFTIETNGEKNFRVPVLSDIASSINFSPSIVASPDAQPSYLGTISTKKAIGQAFSFYNKDSSLGLDIQVGDLLVFDNGVIAEKGDYILIFNYLNWIDTMCVRRLDSVIASEGSPFPTIMLRHPGQAEGASAFGGSGVPASIIAVLIEIRRYPREKRKT